MNKRNRLLFKFRSMLYPAGPSGDSDRGKLYQKYLKSCGKNFKIAEQAFIYSPEKLVVGDNVYIGFSTYLGNGDIHLDDEVLIGNHVSITAANHLRSNGSFRFGGSETKSIKVGAGTWIAAHSCITAGVSIGRGCLVAAGSIVTKNFGDNLLIAGAPAKAIREIQVGDFDGV